MRTLALALIVAPAVTGAVPEVVRTVKAEYPAWAVGAGLSTTVHLKVLVGSDGSARRIEVVPYTVRGDLLGRSMRASFDSAAVRAARGWTFRPATRRGRPVAAWLRVEVPFTDPAGAELPDSIRSRTAWRALTRAWRLGGGGRGDGRYIPGGDAGLVFQRDGSFVERDVRGRERSGRFEIVGGGPGEMVARLTRTYAPSGIPRTVEAARFAGPDTLVLCPWPSGSACDTLVATPGRSGP